MVQGALERLERLEWFKFAVRDPLIRPHFSQFLTVNHHHRESTLISFPRQLQYVIREGR